MFLREVQLNEFRNFSSQKVLLKPRINFFIGENGQGKTNFLEAVYLLSRGRSFRPAEDNVLVRQNFRASGSNPFAGTEAKIRGLFRRESLDFEAKIEIKNGKRSATINSKRAGAVDLIKAFPIILFSPESLQAIKEGPEMRRKLLDELLLLHSPSQVTILREFAKCLKTRNRLLSDLSKARSASTPTLLTLESLNHIYLILATHLAYARIQALQSIQAPFGEAMAMISGSSVPAPKVAIDYLISDQVATGWSESEVYNAMQKRWSQLQAREIQVGRSLVGPHKHDVRFLFAGNDSRFYCSQGQQRALILSLKIAQIVYHQQVHQTYPILLLDDVLSELDPRKREHLMEFLESISAQVLITATDLTWPQQFGIESNSIFSVSAGRIEG
jgi:DNA replication and repair protein RecF